MALGARHCILFLLCSSFTPSMSIAFTVCTKGQLLPKLLSTFLLWKLLQVLMHSHCLAFYQQIKFLYPKFRGVTGLNQKLAKSLGLLTFKAFIKRPVVYVRLFKNVNKNGLLIKTQKKKEKKQGNKTEKFDITTWKHLLQNFPELPITQCRLHKRQNGRGYCKAIWLRTISK